MQLLCFTACVLVPGMQVSLNVATPDRFCCKFARGDPSALPWVCPSEMKSARPGGTCEKLIPVHCRVLIAVLMGAHRDRGVYCPFPHAECHSVHLRCKIGRVVARFSHSDLGKSWHPIFLCVTPFRSTLTACPVYVIGSERYRSYAMNQGGCSLPGKMSRPATPSLARAHARSEHARIRERWIQHRWNMVALLRGTLVIAPHEHIIREVAPVICSEVQANSKPSKQCEPEGNQGRFISMSNKGYPAHAHNTHIPTPPAPAPHRESDCLRSCMLS